MGTFEQSILDSHRRNLETRLEDRFLNEIVDFPTIQKDKSVKRITGKVDNVALETMHGTYEIVLQLDNTRYQFPLSSFIEKVKILRP